jgi:hypothetical protein
MKQKRLFLTLALAPGLLLGAGSKIIGSKSPDVPASSMEIHNFDPTGTPIMVTTAKAGSKQRRRRRRHSRTTTSKAYTRNSGESKRTPK